MNSIRSLRGWLTGIDIPQEYVCVPAVISDPLCVFITWKDNSKVVESGEDLRYLGYKPFIVAWNVPTQSYAGEEMCLHFGSRRFKIDGTWHGFPCCSDSIARIRVRKVTECQINDVRVALYEGVKAVHRFIAKWNQWVNATWRLFKKNRPGNVSLPGNLVEQVRVAYAVPRVISVASVMENGLINLFPNDLHGQLGTTLYANSLRIGGVATQQVERIRKLVLSEMDIRSYREVYSLGKNHMSELKDPSAFKLAPGRSKLFQWPLPEGAIRYRELLLIDSIDIGIHRIHFYEIKTDEMIQLESEGVLAHIHQYYAQWRSDRKLITNMLIR